MNYWDYVGLFSLTEAWGVLSAVLAGVLFAGGIVRAVAASFALADHGKAMWNWALWPALIVAEFFTISLLAWSAGVGLPS